MSEKERAARYAVAHYVRDGMTLGLGTGSTAAFALQAIGEKGFRDIRGVPTSESAAALARAAGIPLIELNDVNQVDLTIDGADEVSPALALIKGGGGALLREKLVAEASREMVVIADVSKLVPQLGAFPLPVEVIPFCYKQIQAKLQALGLSPVLREKNGVTARTDEGNLLLDCHTGFIPNPGALALQLKAITGIVEHGLFIRQATRVVVAQGDSIRVLER
jgi:ribose 5-phosphate isomerase A